MKVVWLISGDNRTSPLLQKELERSGDSYLVRHTDKIPKIPKEHLQSSGVAILIDSFHVEHTGFDGLKQLRELGFRGPIYMFGEPAPEKTTVPFTDLELSGFFPAVERADLSYIAGIIHHCFELNGEMQIPLMLNKEHKAGSAKITQQADLDTITQKLSLFASRFGVKEDTLKNAIMGLCMGHIQTKHGESQIAEPFELKFGTDRNKIVLSVPAHSKGNYTSVLRNEFAQALANFHNSALKNSVLFQEFHHLVKAVNNLSILGGSSKAETEYADPMFLVTRIQFEPPSSNETHMGYYFSIHHTKPSEDLDSTSANLPLVVEAPAGSAEPLTESARISVTSHSENDLREILNDPVVVGDAPDIKGEKISLTESTNESRERQTQISEDEALVNKTYLEQLKSELATLRETNEIMSHDILRLMKERKEPALDAELRKQNEDLKAKLERLEAEFEAALKILSQQIEELKNKDSKDSAKPADKKKAA